MTGFNIVAFVLSRWAFLATHVVFTYWLLFMFNDPLGLLPAGFPTLDVAKNQLKPEGQCSVNYDNITNNVLWWLVWYGTHTLFSRRVWKQAVGLWGSPLDRPIFAAVAPVAWFISLYKWKPVTDCSRFDVFTVPTYTWAVSGFVFTMGVIQLLGLLYSLPDHVFGTSKHKYQKQELPSHDVIEDYPYNLVRHPAAAGFLWMYWSLPNYNANHLLIAGLWTFFIVIGTLVFEEGGIRNEPGEFGKHYREYAKRVAAFYPTPYSLRKLFGLETSKVKAK
jgi:protein-S-isoprenylcysteine O-methyltransferase Ste14